MFKKPVRKIDSAGHYEERRFKRWGGQPTDQEFWQFKAEM